MLGLGNAESTAILTGNPGIPAPFCGQRYHAGHVLLSLSAVTRVGPGMCVHAPLRNPKPWNDCAGYQLRALLVHETFKKVLYLAPTARAEFSSGRVFNLVTSDAETLQVRTRHRVHFEGMNPP